MAKFIKVAEHLRKFNNFNSLMAVLAGLNAAAVFRLKWTKDETGKALQQSLRGLERLMNNTGASKEYRNTLTNVNPPAIPYLGVHLTDLTFVEDGNPDYVGNLINFTKRSLLYEVISKIQQYQQLPYNFHPIHQIQSYIKKYPSLEEAELWPVSLEMEPRKAERHEIL